MVDLDIYNERRQQLIDKYADDPDFFIFAINATIEDLVDNLDWEDSTALAEDMGWTTDESGSGQ